MADSLFYGCGTPADGACAIGRNNVIGISFDASEFDIKGQKGETYTFPITGAFKISDRVHLDYVIPLQYVKLSDVELFQGGFNPDVPVPLLISPAQQPRLLARPPPLPPPAAGTHTSLIWL